MRRILVPVGDAQKQHPLPDRKVRGSGVVVPHSREPDACGQGSRDDVTDLGHLVEASNSRQALGDRGRAVRSVVCEVPTELLDIGAAHTSDGTGPRLLHQSKKIADASS